MDDLSLIRVIIVDDHPLMRSGLAGEINLQPDMEVVAEASNGEEAIACFRSRRPDVTLMDIRMANLDGIEAISRIRADFPSSRFIVLTSSAGDVQALRAFRAGATGYLLKNLLRTELVDTIRAVHAGKRRIPAEIAHAIAEHAVEDAITERELDVLREMSKGKANKIIANVLNISEHTVKNHIKAYFQSSARTTVQMPSSSRCAAATSRCS